MTVPPVIGVQVPVAIGAAVGPNPGSWHQQPVHPASSLHRAGKVATTYRSADPALAAVIARARCNQSVEELQEREPGYDTPIPAGRSLSADQMRAIRDIQLATGAGSVTDAEGSERATQPETGHHIDPWRELEQEHAAMLSHARRYADLGLAPMAEHLGGQPPFPKPFHEAPLVIDTDIGGDPDAAVALVIAARQVPQLALVLTTDEHGGQRARFARHLLDLLGRTDVPVVAGAELHPAERWCCVDELIPDSVPAQDCDIEAALHRALAGTEGTVRWLGCGPPTNLACVIDGRPELAGRLRLTQTGGAFNDRDPARRERNFSRDVPAARSVLRAIQHSWLVTADVTVASELAISADSELYQWLVGRDVPPWARLLRAHFDRWFDRNHVSVQHDPLGLSVALGLPFVDVDLDRVLIDQQGRVRVDPAGVDLFYSHSVDRSAFRRWLTDLGGPVATGPHLGARHQQPPQPTSLPHRDGEDHDS